MVRPTAQWMASPLRGVKSLRGNMLECGVPQVCLVGRRLRTYPITNRLGQPRVASVVLLRKNPWVPYVPSYQGAQTGVRRKGIGGFPRHKRAFTRRRSTVMAEGW